MDEPNAHKKKKKKKTASEKFLELLIFIHVFDLIKIKIYEDITVKYYYNLKRLFKIYCKSF